MALDGTHAEPRAKSLTFGSERWHGGSTYLRQLPSHGRHPARAPPSVVYRNNLRSGTGCLALPQRRWVNQPSNTNPRANQIGRLPDPIAKAKAQPRQLKFRAFFDAFESMKMKGVAPNADPVESVTQKDVGHQPDDEKWESSSQDLVKAMKIFMSSNLPPPTYYSVKPVEDWSKEAENLLEELTDREPQADFDSSVWNIPNPNISVRKNGTSCPPCQSSSSLWSTTTTNEVNDSGGGGFNIHRHIMKINPSPYPGRSPTSTEQSASSHSSDNDADDEWTQSSSETDCDKTVGCKIGLKSFLPSLDGSTLDSGYPSSANESDIARRNGMNVRRSNASTDSDDISELGFTSSTCASWPTSPLPSLWHGAGGRRFCEVTFANATCGIPQPVPMPAPSFCAGLPGVPILPRRPHILPAPFQQPPSVVPTAVIGMPRHPHPPLPMSGLSLLSAMQSLPPFVQHQSVMAAPGIAGETTDRLMGTGTYQKHKAWITDDILEMIAVRDRLYKRMKKHPAPDIVEMYKKVRNMVVGMTRNAKRAYEKQYEEQRMEQQLRKSRHIERLNILGVDPLSIGVSRGRAPQTW